MGESTASTAPAAWWSDQDTLRRFVVDLIVDELARLRPGWRRAPNAVWDDAGTFDAELGVDSLELVQLATALAHALHLHESGLEDYLLARRTLGDWLEIAAAGLRHDSAQLTFTTSGSTGFPKSCTHSLQTLYEECAQLAQLLGDRKRILFAVPSHHIYGFLWTILLPPMLGTPSPVMIDLRASLPSTLPRLLAPGDVVIGYPEFWAALARATAPLPEDVTGVTSTGPCSDSLSDALATAGLARFVQIYGSSETAGVGWRDDHRMPYTLFSHWVVAPDIPDSLLRRDAAETITGSVEVQDCLTWQGDRHFFVGPRLDSGVQVGGMNVFPARVAEQLKQHPLVADAAVRLMRAEEGTRLKAFIVFEESVIEIESGLDSVRAWIDQHLPPMQRPKAFTVGSAVPRSDTGKPCDWTI